MMNLDDPKCSGTVTCAVLESLWEVYFVCSTFILLSIRKNLTNVSCFCDEKMNFEKERY